MSHVPTRESSYNKQIKGILNKAGYSNMRKIANTLQGSVWRATKLSTKKKCVIKVANKYLQKNGIGLIKNEMYKVDENILTEGNILKYLTSQQNAPNSIVKYIEFFQSKTLFFLSMEDGGNSLFDFIVKVHKLMQRGYIDIAEWHKMVKIILKQMIECIEYIHSKNICHFDISLENFLVNDVKVEYNSNDVKNSKMRFVSDDVIIKLCDFGLSSHFNQKQTFRTKKYCGKESYKSPECVAETNYFDAKSNDIWSLGVCLFMMVIGGPPCFNANKSDPFFIHIICGNIVYLIDSWDKIDYLLNNKHLILLFQSIFQYEKKRINLQGIKQHLWLN